MQHLMFATLPPCMLTLGCWLWGRTRRLSCCLRYRGLSLHNDGGAHVQNTMLTCTTQCSHARHSAHTTQCSLPPALTSIPTRHPSPYLPPVPPTLLGCALNPTWGRLEDEAYELEEHFSQEHQARLGIRGIRLGVEVGGRAGYRG